MLNTTCLAAARTGPTVARQSPLPAPNACTHYGGGQRQVQDGRCAYMRPIRQTSTSSSPKSSVLCTFRVRTTTDQIDAAT
eukprot:1458001-Pleurochrysis_carterae.AAC.1